MFSKSDRKDVPIAKFGEFPYFMLYEQSVSCFTNALFLLNVSVYNIPYPMFFMYALIIGKIVAMRFKFYNEKGKFNKNDKVLVS